MTFDEVLAQVVALLQRQGRVSYGALKRRFALDDAYLDDLKTELIDAQRLAVDEDGRILVWVGATDTLPALSPLPPTLPLALQADEPLQEQTPAVALPDAEAERRHLTVLFCDLVGSTALAGQLDPEDLREVIRAYQQTCAEVIQRFDGHIAQYLGDGVLVYFGYPQAHEDDAHRAVHAGLGILQAMDTLHARLARKPGVHLAVRLGIHTGVVVVGTMGGGARQEHLALGDTPNIAARLQGLAAPDTIVISAATFRLVEGYFTCQALGAQPLKGVATPLQVYQVVRQHSTRSRFDVATSRGLTPLVGREQEVGVLLARWAQARDGMGQVVVLSGEAGIGKSRLVQVLKEHVARESVLQITLRCSPYHAHSALYPVIEHLHQLLQGSGDDASSAPLAVLERLLAAAHLPLPEVVPLFTDLLSLPVPAHYAPLALSPQRQKQKTLEALVAWLLAETERQPVFMVWEDLHWGDPSTLELLTLTLDQIPLARFLLLATCRPEFTPPWGFRAYLTPLHLSRLARSQTESLVEHVVGSKTLPTEVCQQIVTKTDGVPLFVEELTKTVLESDLLQEQADRYELRVPLPALAIPATLHDSLMARLDRLASVKTVAQLAATIGRDFAYDLLQAVAPWDEPMVQYGLRQLIEADLLAQRGVPPQATYQFKHALIQDAAYQSLLKSTRQQHHQRIAQVLAERFPELTETQPELLAHHYTAGGDTAQAITYWHRAGQRAHTRSAHVEASRYLRMALDLLMTLPETPERAQHELTLQLALGTAFMMIKGPAAPEVEQTYVRARTLCTQVGATPQLFPALNGLAMYYIVRAKLGIAYEFGEQCLQLAHHQDDGGLLLLAQAMVGFIAFCRGALMPAQGHLEHVLARYDPQQHRPLASLAGFDPGVACWAFAAALRWMLGYPDQALQHSRQALRLGQALAHPFSQAHALIWEAIVHQLRREASATWERAEATVTLATEQGFPFYLAGGTLWRGWALASQGQGAEGIAQLCQSLAGLRAAGAEQARSWQLALLAEAYGQAGQPEAGLVTLEEALSLVDTNEERFYEAELYRLQGELLQQVGSERQQVTESMLSPEACLQRALAIARQQGAKSLELRAAMSLSRLWQRQGQRAAAHCLLAEIYGWFTEGFDTADLQDAKILLEELT